MITMALVLLAAGLLAILLEFFVPGGILGAIGVLLILGSLIMFALHSDSFILTLLYFIGTGIAVAFLIKFALWRISNPNRKSGIYSGADQEGYLASNWDKSLKGKEGRVSSDLRPGGHIIIEGTQYSAISQSGYITKGESVVVVGGEGESLLVKNSAPSGSNEGAAS